MTASSRNFLLSTVACCVIPILGFSTVPAGSNVPPVVAEVLSAKQAVIEAKDGELNKLLKDRFNASLKVTQVLLRDTIRGKRSPVEVLMPAGMLLKSELDLASEPKERVKAIEKLVHIMKHLEATADSQMKNGRCSAVDCERVRSYRLNAEIQLFRAKQGTN